MTLFFLDQSMWKRQPRLTSWWSLGNYEKITIKISVRINVLLDKQWNAGYIRFWIIYIIKCSCNSITSIKKRLCGVDCLPGVWLDHISWSPKEWRKFGSKEYNAANVLAVVIWTDRISFIICSSPGVTFSSIFRVFIEKKNCYVFIDKSFILQIRNFEIDFSVFMGT